MEISKSTLWNMLEHEKHENEQVDFSMKVLGGVHERDPSGAGQQGGEQKEQMTWRADEARELKAHMFCCCFTFTFCFSYWARIISF